MQKPVVPNNNQSSDLKCRELEHNNILEWSQHKSMTPNVGLNNMMLKTQRNKN